jgi:hypothetical protein
LWDLTSTEPLWTLPEATKTTVLHVRATSSTTTSSSSSSLWLAVLTPPRPSCQFDNQKILTGSQDVTVYDAKSSKNFPA